MIAFLMLVGSGNVPFGEHSGCQQNGRALFESAASPAPNRFRLAHSTEIHAAFLVLAMSQSMSEWMFRPRFVML
jgi:hypothetical protein